MAQPDPIGLRSLLSDLVLFWTSRQVSERSGAFADKASQDHSKSVNIDLSSSDRGPEQDPTSQPIAAGLSQAVLIEVDVFGVNPDWPPEGGGSRRCESCKVVAASLTGRRDRADGIGVSVVAVPTDTASEKR